MPFASFHDYFPEIAERETRTVTIFRSAQFELPPGQYVLLEMYCDEAGCDCRRVFFYVTELGGKSPAAVVAYGWEPAEFYAKWMGDDDPEFARQMKGPILNLGSPQSEHAPKILRVIEEVVLRDPAYVLRLRAHYDLFRRKVDEPKRSNGKTRKR